MQTYHPDWYAAFVKTGEEDNVRSRLEYRFGQRLRFMSPKRNLRERKDGQWQDVFRPLFPGYLLINGRVGTEEYYEFKNIPGLWKLLCSGNELLSISPREMNIISRLIKDGEIIGPSTLREEGGNVRITGGPLTGMEGHIIKIDKRKGRAKVKMNFLNEERVIDLSINLLTNP